jgi:beta-galactosidase
LECGTVPGVYPTINFGAAIPFSALTESAAKSYFELQRNYSGGGWPKLFSIKSNYLGPKVNSEFYTMWLSVWTDPGLYPQQIEPILKAMDIFWAQNVSFSFYMFHGGTNFGSIAGRLAAVPVSPPPLVDLVHPFPHPKGDHQLRLFGTNQRIRRNNAPL